MATNCGGQLLDLLDLKQKSATLKEARSTSEQGQVIMLFTIVTIIFVSIASLQHQPLAIIH